MAHLNVTLPGPAKVGDSLDLTATVTDWTIVEEFVCEAVLTLEPAAITEGGSTWASGSRTSPKPRPVPSSRNPAVSNFRRLNGFIATAGSEKSGYRR